jgi:hypothetical protein
MNRTCERQPRDWEIHFPSDFRERRLCRLVVRDRMPLPGDAALSSNLVVATLYWYWQI